ncbi:ABC transporter permease [Paenibacillus alkalitolerans]|uniref:ABC transporter permease n=1 Tax=Paenibacillus alkalitolerans TaxID=2799335 RepID=UPI0018F5CBD4|nr:ABC transporter permease [Paenibacillus alkalitolerans]
MNSLLPLVRNETVKIWKKKRFFVILLILAALIPIFTYAQVMMAENFRKQTGTNDWRIEAETQINDYKSRISSTRLPEEWKKWYRVEIQRLQYYINHNIDPASADGVTFAREFTINSVSLFLPLMVMVIAADLVSSEHSQGTIKLLLTRPVRRWKVLTSKYVALTLYVSLTVMCTAALAYVISGAVLGYSGWRAPVLTGFAVAGSAVDTSNVHMIEQWQYLLMVLGLAWFSCMTVAVLSMMISVLVRSTAAGMGTMLALLIAGTILSNMASDWESAKYFFMVNLDTVVYLAGQSPPIPGMTLPFSLGILSLTALGSLVVSYAVFTRRDVMN